MVEMPHTESALPPLKRPPTLGFVFIHFSFPLDSKSTAKALSQAAKVANENGKMVFTLKIFSPELA